MNLRANLYRAAVRLPRALANKLVKREGLPHWKDIGVTPLTSQRVLAHVASVGELEVLRAVIEHLAQSSHKGAQSIQWIVTCFSPSAVGPLKRLKNEIPQVSAVGFCPLEGEWLAFLKEIKPSLFVSIKYEAWPELWGALIETQTKVLMIGAKKRKSLLWAAQIVQKIWGAQPEIIACLDLNLNEPNREKIKQEAEKLLECIPQAKVIATGDPRWDRIKLRSQKQNPKVELVRSKINSKSGRVLILGSVHREDVDVLMPGLLNWKEQLWVVPHHIHKEEVTAIQKKFESFGKNVSLVSRLQDVLNPNEGNADVWMVDEMGYLAELYRDADLAYVGGGFSTGIHSTMEPAIYGIPISVGPQGFGRFQEISDLESWGQLTRVRDAHDFTRWLQLKFDHDRAAWNNEINLRFGASEQVAKVLLDSLLIK